MPNIEGERPIKRRILSDGIVAYDADSFLRAVEGSEEAKKKINLQIGGGSCNGLCRTI